MPINVLLFFMRIREPFFQFSIHITLKLSHHLTFKWNFFLLLIKLHIPFSFSYQNRDLPIIRIIRIQGIRMNSLIIKQQVIHNGKIGMMNLRVQSLIWFTNHSQWRDTSFNHLDFRNWKWFGFEDYPYEERKVTEID